MDSPRSADTGADLLVYPGAGLKSLGIGDDGALRVAGYLVRFSDEHRPDLSGDYFTKSTDFGALSDGLPVTLPAYYDHGLDATLKNERIGTAMLKMDDEGVFAEYTISRRQKYLERLVAEGHMGQSSGAVAHLVDRAEGPEGKAWWLKSWPLGEASLTPTPAEPSTTALHVKSAAATPPTSGPLASDPLALALKSINDRAAADDLTRALRAL